MESSTVSESGQVMLHSPSHLRLDIVVGQTFKKSDCL